MAMFHEGNRALQDKYGGRAVADKIVELAEFSEFNEDLQAFVQTARFFFLATAAEDVTDCSFKGGAPGFVRVTGPKSLIFPDYDGNRMYKSLGNILKNPNIGMLFINFGAEEGQGALFLRLRVNGRASLHDDHPALTDYPGAKRIVAVEVRHIFPNCPRYVPQMTMIAPSRYVPKAGEPQPDPAWKEMPEFSELLEKE